MVSDEPPCLVNVRGSNGKVTTSLNGFINVSITQIYELYNGRSEILDTTKEYRIYLHGKHGHGKYALVDALDFNDLNRHKWFSDKHGYASRGVSIDGRPQRILMHRIIMNTPEGLVTDHINGNRLDNRRGNLRIATQAENTYNKKPIGDVAYKGVCWDKMRQKWQVRVSIDGVVKFQEYVDDAKYAARVYDYYARKLFGEYAYLNFPDDPLLSHEKRNLRSNNTSGYLGVSWSKDKQKWHAYIKGLDGKRINIGRFTDKHEAADAYNQKAIELYGETTQLNKITVEGGGDCGQC
jgi:hypothetical protein